MKKITYSFALLIIIISSDGFVQHHGGGMMNGSKGKDPAIAALLSIQPLPVAFGNFYAGNWDRGIIYTIAELALFIPVTVLLRRNNWGLGMHNNSSIDYSDNRRWTNNERTQFYYLLAGYVLAKVISAFDAGYSVEIYNQNLSMNYDVRTNSAMVTLNITVR